jgi:glycosyltransferase involved in cell wall biosynthesis
MKISSNQRAKQKLLIFIVAYHAEATIQKVLKRIPVDLVNTYEIEVLVIDDASADQTFELANQMKMSESLPFKITVLINPVNQKYGGNQKLGYLYAIKNNFDFVALVHGDGQYAPECLPELVKPLAAGEASAVFGSRMMEKGQAFKGGMPLYKFVGNKILSWFENQMLNIDMSEFHSGYRIYSVKALKQVPFKYNTNEFHFDTEIIIQFVFAGLKINELPIPTYYGDEICRVDGLKYARDVFWAVLRARIHKLGLYYDRRFDCIKSNRGNIHYAPKFESKSPHTLSMEKVKLGSRVLDLGCAGGYLSTLLKEKKGCYTTAVDIFPLDPDANVSEFIEHNLNEGMPDVDFKEYDDVLLLDVIEHLASPEKFIDSLKEAMGTAPNSRLIISTANIGFFITRFSLLFGEFNYGKKGILDMTHTRLFTFSSLKRLLIQSGFDITETIGIPGPYQLALGSNFFSRFLVTLNVFLINISKRLFAYQIYMTVKAKPSLEYLLEQAHEHSAKKVKLGQESLVG